MTGVFMSLLPIDVGWDLKVQGKPVYLLKTDRQITVKFLDRQGHEMTKTGTVTAIRQILQRHGYKVKFQ